MQYDLQVLKNSLKTLFVHSPGATAGSVQIWFQAGSALEKKSEQGLAHFLEHMFFKGTKKRPGHLIAYEAEGLGSEINAFTSFDYTCYYINTPNTGLVQSIDILMDMVTNPSFKLNDIEIEKGVVLEEFLRSVDNPRQVSFQKLIDLCFTGGYSHAVLGTQKRIKGFTKAQLIEFRKKFYNTENALLVVGGDLSKKDQLVKKIEKFKMPKGKKSVFPKFKLGKESKLEVYQKDVHQDQILICLESAEYKDDTSAAEDLAFCCLGHGESSRFYRPLVLDSQKASSVSASTMFMSRGGAHYISISCPHENIEDVLEMTFKVLENAITDKFTEEEIQKIKNQYLSAKIYEKETIESFSFSLGNSFSQYNDIEADNIFTKKIEDLQVEEVNRSFRKILSRNINVSIQIPDSEKVSPVEKLAKKFMKKYEGLGPLALAHREDEYSLVKSSHDSQVNIVELFPGFKLVHRYSEMTPTFVAQMTSMGGLSDEHESENGIYGLLSGVITKGHKEISELDLKTLLETRSSSMTCFSGKNSYGLTLHGLSQHFVELLEHFLMSFYHPEISSKALDDEKELVYRSLEGYMKDPVKLLFNKVNETFFKNHPYSLNVYGSKESVEQISKLDIEKKHIGNLHANEVVLTYCGNKKLDEVAHHIKKVFGEKSIHDFFQNVKAKKSKKLKTAKLKAKFLETSIDIDREQSHIFVGYPTFDLMDERNHSIKILNTYLSGQSSELFVEMRDRRGLCYVVRPVTFSALEGGYWGIYIGTANDKVVEAQETILQFIEDFSKNAISQKDFLRSKKIIEGQNLLNIQSNEDFVNIYSAPVLYNLGIDYFYQSQKEISKLTYGKFKKDIKNLMSSKLTILKVGPSQMWGTSENI
jgi:zinc protease